MFIENKYLVLVQQDTAITPLRKIKVAVTGKSEWPLMNFDRIRLLIDKKDS